MTGTPIPDSRANRCCSTVRNTNDLCGQKARPGSHLCQRCADFLDHALIPGTYPSSPWNWYPDLDAFPPRMRLTA